MKIIPVILLLVFSCAVCAQELKEKYPMNYDHTQLTGSGKSMRPDILEGISLPAGSEIHIFAGMRSRLLQVLILYW